MTGLHVRATVDHRARVMRVQVVLLASVPIGQSVVIGHRAANGLQRVARRLPLAHVTSEHRVVRGLDHRVLTMIVVRVKVASARTVPLEIVHTEMPLHSACAQSGHLAPEPAVQPVLAAPLRQVMVVQRVRAVVVPAG